MNESLPPIRETAPPKPDSKRAIVFGFAVGAVPWLIAIIPQKDYGQIGCLILSCFVVPLIAGALAIFSRTRKFGLGLLLASGVGWLVLGAICGGVFRKS